VAALSDTTRPVRLHLAGEEQADRLLAAEPLALLLGMLLDQQIPMERAFAAPALLAERLGQPLRAKTLAEADPAWLEGLFAAKPALHRFPAAMARRAQALCQALVADHQGDPTRLWTEATDGPDLVRRLAALPGFGEQKAKIFAALLAKQLGVRPRGWQQATAPFGEPGVFLSLADIVDPASLAAVREAKQAMKRAAKAAR
jgi:uncharacterized HhH-GPD family protein